MNSNIVGVTKIISLRRAAERVDEENRDGQKEIGLQLPADTSLYGSIFVLYKLHALGWQQSYTKRDVVASGESAGAE